MTFWKTWWRAGARGLGLRVWNMAGRLPSSAAAASRALSVMDASKEAPHPKPRFAPHIPPPPPLSHRRSEMAALLGHRSYAHLKAADATLAGAPEAASAFLESLTEARCAAPAFAGLLWFPRVWRRARDEGA